ncbi:MAG: hypothetical protein WBN89_05430 [Prochlorococcaceae cyanobacterium]
MNKQLIFVAKRNDGLGERLRAMLNAIALSDVYDAGFRFTWRMKSHDAMWSAIRSVEQVFHPEYIRLYHQFLPGNLRPASEYLLSRENGCYSCNQSLLVNNPSLASQPHEMAKYRKAIHHAFDKIGFSDSVRAAMAAAGEMAIDRPSIALHLRGGDIIYGKFKQSIGHSFKTIPLPVALEIITNASQCGDNVLLFGQDDGVIGFLSENPNTIVAKRLIPSSFGLLEAEFFELSLMARCKAIYAGSSGFALLACRIGGTKRIDIGKTHGDREIAMSSVKCVRSGLLYDDRISTMQLAHNCMSLMVRYRDILLKDEVADLIAIGSKSDPSNFFFTLADIWYEYEHGNPRKANQILSSVLHEQTDRFEEFILSDLATPGQAKKFASVFSLSVLARDHNSGLARFLLYLVEQTEAGRRPVSATGDLLSMLDKISL